MAAQWTLSDAWVFSSIKGTGPDNGYTLSQIIECADAINHAGLIEEEFTQAVPRLVAAGLIGVQVEADRYWRTRAGRALFWRRMIFRDLFGWIEAIPPALRGLGEPQDTAWSLPTGVIDRATREYRRRSDKRISQLFAQRQDSGDTLASRLWNLLGRFRRSRGA